jgi:mono/diheme cytochrome c family protein
MKLPRWILFTVAVLVVLSWVPLALIMRARATTSPKPRIHVVPDMDNQPKFRSQTRNPMFADRRAMRPPVDGTIPQEEVLGEPALTTGKVGGSWVDAIPIEVDLALMRRGRERFDIYCSPCHGLAGFGDGMVAKRADELQEGTWTPPSSFHTDLVRGRPAGHIFNTISNGIRNMPAYGPQIPVEDRWAIVAYVRALQRSQHATVDDVPPDTRAQLR